MAISTSRTAIGVILAAGALGLGWWLTRSTAPASMGSAAANATTPPGTTALALRYDEPAMRAEPASSARATTPAHAAGTSSALAERTASFEARKAAARRKREQLRARAQSWSNRAGSGAAGAGVEPPVLDFDYASKRIEEHFIPLAKDCYDALLEQQPDARGVAELSFEIVGDEEIGGVIEALELTDESTLDEPEFVTCVSESLLSVQFDPPPSHGRATIVYRARFGPSEEEAPR
jgi:hypothetical protein